LLFAGHEEGRGVVDDKGEDVGGLDGVGAPVGGVIGLCCCWGRSGTREDGNFDSPGSCGGLGGGR
jgi:hypothetical protein